MNKNFTNNDATIFIKHMKMNIEHEKFTLNDIVKGMNVELEHGTRNKETNVTNDDLIMTGKIALAHLNEFPDYYQRLDKLEEEATKYWKKKNITNIKKYVLKK